MGHELSRARVKDIRTINVRLSASDLYCECIDCGADFHIAPSPDVDVCRTASEHRAGKMDW